MKWVKIEHYSSKDYIYSPYDEDPFDYSFNSGVSENDSARRKADIALAIRKTKILPEYVRKIVSASRASK